MRTVQEIKDNIIIACCEKDCPDWLVGEIGQLVNELENTIHSEYNNTNYQLFKNSLTFAEDEALDKIINKIHIEGIISINSLSRETGISRPVFNNLLNKLENAKLITVNNMGAKGTYIKFINQKLLQERGII